jgi:hypothetical protein
MGVTEGSMKKSGADQVVTSSSVAACYAGLPWRALAGTEKEKKEKSAKTSQG